jgi:phosphopantothenoylcysteine decarboxylase / phosphopantothenate---cysteine ligase
MNKNIQCLVSAGPTREWIDPVRFISNPSTGKMGYALAEEAAARGFLVDLVSGPVHLDAPQGVRVSKVETAIEMEKAMLGLFEKAQLVIMTAAVCDHRPKQCWPEKRKKSEFPSHLELVENTDIVGTLCQKRNAGQTIVGFAAETENAFVHSREKLEGKGLDWIAVNDVSDKEIGFASDFNEVTLLSRSGESIPLGRKSKKEIAKGILDHVWP